MNTDPTATRPQQAAKVVLAVVLTGLGVWTVAEFLPALAWSGILAIAFWPLYQRCVRRWPPGRHNLALPLLFTVGISMLVLVPLVLAGLQAVREAHGIYDWVDSVRKSGMPAPAMLSHLPVGAREATDWWNENLANPGAAEQLLHRVNRSDLELGGRHLGAEILHRVILFVFTLVALFFLFRDGDTLAYQLRRASTRAFGAGGERVGRQMVASVHGTVDGLVLVGLGEGFLLGVAYFIAGVPHPALLGSLTAIAAMIPFGAPVIFGIAALLLAVQGSITAAIIIVTLGIVVTFVADHFIRPVLIGGATRLPFLWVLFGILGGVKTWGLLGLFLGPAIMAALILLWREWVEDE